MLRHDAEHVVAEAALEQKVVLGGRKALRARDRRGQEGASFDANTYRESKPAANRAPRSDMGTPTQSRMHQQGIVHPPLRLRPPCTLALTSVVRGTGRSSSP